MGLLTDGVNNRGSIDPRTAAQAAAAFGVKIYTVGVGTEGMAPVPVGRGVFGLRYENRPVEIDDALLTDVAKRTGGRYFRARDGIALQRITEEIDRLERTPVRTRVYTRYSELYRWPLGIALLALALELSLAAWRGRCHSGLDPASSSAGSRPALQHQLQYEHDPEPVRVVRQQDLYEVHPPHTDGAKGAERCDHRQPFRDRAEPVRHLREVAVQGAAQKLTEGVERVVDTQDMIVHVPEVELGLRWKQRCRPVRQHVEDFAHRSEVATQRKHRPLEREDVVQRGFIEAFEHARLEAVDEFVHAIEEREERIDRGVADRVRQTRGSVNRSGLR